MINKIPGFRSNRKRNKIIGVAGYVFFLICLLASWGRGQTPLDSFVREFTWVLMFLAFYLPITNLFNVRHKLIFFNRKSLRGRVLGITGFVICCAIVIGTLNMVQSDKQKSFNAAEQAKYQEARAATAKLDEQRKAVEDKKKQDAKAQADAEAKAKAAADASAKVKAEEDAKAAADAKAKSDAAAKVALEEKQKADAEAAKAAADAKAKADAESALKAQEDAKIKADLAAKASAAEEKVKVDTDTKAIVEPDPKTKSGVDEDTAYLKAVDTITYNTFVEASAIGDQLKQLGSSKISMGDFSDFMDSDASLWGMYIKKIEPTNPQNIILILTRENILNDLNDLKKEATSMKTDAADSNLNKVVSDSRDMTVTLNQIKQHYGEAVSQMKNHGIDANWNP